MPKRKNRKAKVAKPTKKKVTRPKKIVLTEVKSPRQLLVVKKLSEAIGKSKGKKAVSLGKIMREAGYSPSFSKYPAKLIKTKNFQELLKEHLPNDMLSKVHAQVIQASTIDHRVFPESMSDKEMTDVVESISGCKVKKIMHGEKANHVWYWTPDNANRLNAVKEAYKIKDLYPTQKHEVEFKHKLTKEYLDRIIKD